MDPYGSSGENTVILVEIENTIIMKKCVNVRLSALNTLSGSEQLGVCL